MAVPQSCSVLVVGGGPAGSYAAAALAREGIDTVVLEADKFPRYHIGESTLPSLRHFFKFIDFYDTVDAHGFYRKVLPWACSASPAPRPGSRVNKSMPHHRTVLFSGSLKISPTPASLYQPRPCVDSDSASRANMCQDTDFLEAGGPGGYAWNLIRSEFDDLLFRHAGTCGARVFSETKVDAIRFASETDGTQRPDSTENRNGTSDPGRPVSATWVRKDGTSGSIRFEYLVDASGRHGILSTKYLKNRRFNENFKNAALWAYWRSDNVYGRGTHMHGSPYFEALDDASGWAWFMPLHDGTRSVGIVQDQKMAADRKRELGRPSTVDFYRHCLEMAPRTSQLLSGAELVPDVRSAADWSYTASTYHLPCARICGDAGSFIDPLFSSGVHLAVTGGLSAAATIAASIRGDCGEEAAGAWHSKKTVESYTRFFLAVSSATKQIRARHEPVIQDMDEDGFQRAFDLFKPIIQGTADADTAGKVSRAEISKILAFCFKAFTYVPPEKKDALFDKLRRLDSASARKDAHATAAAETLDHDDMQKHLTADELQVLETLRSRRMVREDPFEMDSFTLDTIDGMAPRLVRGSLGLVRSEQAKIDRAHFYAEDFLDGKHPGIREGSVYMPASRVRLEYFGNGGVSLANAASWQQSVNKVEIRSGSNKRTREKYLGDEHDGLETAD
ncbi:Tryptophan halogenase [Metarhizium album ARSEF 1941]|uniref:Tryptophan halogenase n=1 Tax=Metarhizium album (strain ARSEF 1941) TaxID=1081103 RepID=A0A0B2X351_METAS|nr:Tryptophan halogenase [Metarhizium album ARSEF 1941]KHN99829.1 Tryptophan halogenase [Metarhizium album ARSEF 1941]